MKLIYSIIIIMFMGCLTAFAQNQCGLYRTIADFKAQQISIPAYSKFGKKAIQVSDFFLRPYVYIKTDSGKMKISMDSIYAVRCSTGKIFRVWNQKAYLLEDSSCLQIYSYKCMATVKCRTSRGFCYRWKQVTNYYFSADDSSQMHTLTLINLKQVLKLNNEAEKKMLEAFPNDKSLQHKTNNDFNINNFLSTIR